MNASRKPRIVRIAAFLALVISLQHGLSAKARAAGVVPVMPPGESVILSFFNHPKVTKHPNGTLRDNLDFSRDLKVQHGLAVTEEGVVVDHHFGTHEQSVLMKRDLSEKDFSELRLLLNESAEKYVREGKHDWESRQKLSAEQAATLLKFEPLRLKSMRNQFKADSLAAVAFVGLGTIPLVTLRGYGYLTDSRMSGSVQAAPQVSTRTEKPLSETALEIYEATLRLLKPHGHSEKAGAQAAQ